MKDILVEIQNSIYFMIPEKWKKIGLYASIGNINKKGEMFFYYLPDKKLSSFPVNCYEIPEDFDIDERDYLEILTKLYNKIKLLHLEYYETTNKNWQNVTIIIEKRFLKVVFEYYSESMNIFNEFEKHVIWRFKYLDIAPETKKEKKIIKKFLDVYDNLRIEREIFSYPVTKKITHNIVGYLENF